MTTCKSCGKEKIVSEFDFLFTKEAIEDALCSKCHNKLIKKARENNENYSVNQEEVF